MRILFFTTVLLLSACATEVTSINTDQDKNLSKERGYILLGIESNRDLKSILINGPEFIKLTAKDLKKGSNYLLVDLEAGVYNINKINLDNYWYLDIDDEDKWLIEIKPQEINYVGHIELNRMNSWTGYTKMELVNRSSEALEFIEDEYPNISSKRAVVYGGPGEDNFFEVLTKLRESK